MRFDSLDAWLTWQETLNPRGIELGLDRVKRVLGRMQLLDPPYRVLTIGGTNGKGSVASYAESLLRASGHATGRYLSPHIRHYNERIAVDGVEAGDDELCAAFEAVDRARGDEALTYFEFGTLAALEVFGRRDVDVAVLEVGLGGRLDAVNAVEPDVSVVVSVGLDHVDWLGSSIENIALEKSGIFRTGKPALFGSAHVPDAVRREAQRIGAELAVYGREFSIERNAASWSFRDSEVAFEELPLPPLAGAHQFANAATAIAAVRCLVPEIGVRAVRAGVAATRLPGRLQSVGGRPEVLLDVGHNPDAATHIAAFLHADPRPTQVVLAMLADKDAAGFVRELVPHVDQWHFASLDGSRGRSGTELAEGLALTGLDLRHDVHESVADAVRCASTHCEQDGRVLVAGSFHTVADFLVYFGDGAAADAGQTPSGT